MLHVVKYSGVFGFIKPWTAVRDEETYSQQFLTPSMIEGIEKKLFPENFTSEEMYQTSGSKGLILRHRISYIGLSPQQEQTWSKTWKKHSDESKKFKRFGPNTGIIKRGLLLSPEVHLAFSSYELAEKASREHFCLCRNEDVMLPDYEVLVISEDQFNNIPGFELIFDDSPSSILVSYNRFYRDIPKAMYGNLVSFGDPIRKTDSI